MYGIIENKNTGYIWYTSKATTPAEALAEMASDPQSGYGPGCKITFSETTVHSAGWLVYEGDFSEDLDGQSESDIATVRSGKLVGAYSGTTLDSE
jgi:hypothetical protein